MTQVTGDTAPDSEPVGVLCSLTRVAASRPGITLAATLISVILCVTGTVLFLKFKTERSDLIDPSAEFHQRWQSYTDSFGDSSDLVVIFEGLAPEATVSGDPVGSPDDIKLAMDDLGSRMVADTEHFSQVLYRIEPGELRTKGLQYLSPQQLEETLNLLEEFRPVLEGQWDRLRLDALGAALLFQLRDHLQELEENPANQQAALRLAGTLRQVRQLAVSLDGFFSRSEFTNPWPEMVSVDPRMRDTGDQVIYTLSEDGRIGFLKARPVRAARDFDGATVPIDRARALIEEIRGSHPQVRISLTGIPVLENDEMRRSQSDMTTATLISLVGVALLLLAGFRGFRHPLLAVLMLAVGMAWSFGFITLAIGHLNILSVSFAAILVGLGIDFAIHYLAKYLDCRHQGVPLLESLQESSRSIGTGIVTGAVTTSAAFFCAAFTEFLGVAELGIIAGGGILLCVLATFLVLPALIASADRGWQAEQLPFPFRANALRNTIAKHPALVLLAALTFIGVCGRQGLLIRDGHIESAVAYDYNLMNLQADGLESVEVQKRIFQDVDEHARPGQASLLFAVSIASSAEDALRRKAAFEKLSTVHHVEEMASKLPAWPPAKTKLLVQGIRSQLDGLPKDLPPPAFANPNLVGKAYEELHELTGTMQHPLAPEAHAALNRFLDVLDQLEIDQQVQLLMQYQGRMTAALIYQLRRLHEAANSEPITIEDFPSELASRFVSRGKWLLQVYPKSQVWDIEPLTEFVSEVRQVDPEITGTPLQNFEAARQIMNSYQKCAVYALAVVTLLLLLDFLGLQRSLRTALPSAIITMCIGIGQWITRGQMELWVLLGSFMGLLVSLSLIIDWHSVIATLLTLMPPLLGGLMMFGVMQVLGVSFNPANLIVLPLLLGIGVDNGVHVVHDYARQRDHYRLSASTTNAIILTSLTTLVGFGSMMIAAHRGIYSLGLVFVIGVSACLFVSLVLLPAVLTIIRNWQLRSSLLFPAPLGESRSAPPAVVPPGARSERH